MALRIYSWRVAHTTKSGSSVTDAGTGWLSHEGAASRPYHNAQFGTQQQINSILLHWVVGTWLWWFVSHEGRQANHKLPHLIALQDTCHVHNNSKASSTHTAINKIEARE